MPDGSGRTALDWGDGEYTFRLPMKQLRELQDKTGLGPEALYNRIATGAWRVEDIRETIRLGLIGGGMDEVKAVKLVRQYIDDAPLLKHKPTAIAIILAALLGPPNDPIPVGKPEAGSEPSTSPSPPISESLAQSE